MPTLATTQRARVASAAAAPGAARRASILRPLTRALSASARRPGRANPVAASTGKNAGDTSIAANAPVTDDAVPEAHRGLHASLYGDGDAADVHGSVSRSGSDDEGPYRARPEDDGETVVPLDSWLSERGGAVTTTTTTAAAAASTAANESGKTSSSPPPVPGVYAVFDSTSRLQHVGYARDAVRAVRAAREAVGSERASLIRARLFAPGQGKMVSRGELSSLAASWLAEEARTGGSSSSSPPPGNTPAEAALWAGGGGGVAALSESSATATSSSSSASSTSSSDGESSTAAVVVAPATAARGMTPAQRALHADRKDKLEKAMGVKKKDQNDHEKEQEASLSSEERRAKLRSAVEGGDWSAVIDEQTRETIPAAASSSSSPDVSSPAPVSPVPPVPPPPQQNRPVTPFARASVHRAVGDSSSSPSSSVSSSSSSSSAAAAASSPAPTEPFVLTVEAAEEALDEVRPYLIADGGNVEVVEVVPDDGGDGGGVGGENDQTSSFVVRVRLQGACGTCGSAGATMAMGIERALKATFGAAVSRVERVVDGDPSALAAAEASAAAAAVAAAGGITVDDVDSLLDGLRPAISAYNGSVEVLSVSPDTGVATLRYTGPDSIGVGITMAVRDRFPSLSDVRLVS